jgi:SagB-type dehydrogenase family enzyme
MANQRFISGQDVPTLVFGDRGLDSLEMDDPAELFHEASKYYPGVTRAFLPITRFYGHPYLQALSRRSSLPPITGRITALPAAQIPNTGFADLLAARRSARAFEPSTMTLGALATVLYCAYGVMPPRGEGQATKYRAVPSGGAMYPLDVFVFARAVDGLPRAVYQYLPVDHALSEVSAFDDAPEWESIFTQDDVVHCPALIIIAASFHRTRMKYGLRGYRFALLEAGHVGQNIMLAATALDIGVRPVGGYYDSQVDGAIDADGVNQSSVYVITLGRSVESTAAEVD